MVVVVVAAGAMSGFYFSSSSSSSSSTATLPPLRFLVPPHPKSGVRACCGRGRMSAQKNPSYFALGRSSFLTRRLCCCSGHGSSAAAVASMVGRKTTKKREVVIPDPDYRIPVILLGLAGGFVYQENLLPAATVGLLGLLLLFQTTRVRFVFDEEALEVKVGDELKESGENVFVGGKNRWKYSTFVNWELWWPNFPILVYFKETQTKPEGQVHFFPVIFDGRQLYDVMVERAGPSKTSGPKES